MLLGMEWYWWLLIVIVLVIAIPLKIKAMKWWNDYSRKRKQDEADKWGDDQ